MIQAAMMFALGFCVCGLIALAASSALARRTRRLAEQRVKQRYATKRLEFETERDELRARHAVEIQRLQRELRTIGDQATAFRLESAMKDIENDSLNSDLDDKEEEIDDLNDRLDALHVQLRDSDRKVAESGTALRAARHALQTRTTDQAFGVSPYSADNDDPADSFATPAVNGHDRTDTSGDKGTGSETEDAPLAPGPPTPESVSIEKIASEIRRISSETENEVRRLHPDEALSKGLPPPADPDGSAVPPPAASRATAKLERLDVQGERPGAAADENEADPAEERFLEAMDQIRTLKKAGGSAAE